MSRTSPSPRAVTGFTLVELLVVIGIIALLISILLPSLQKARDSATKAACLSNLRQVALYFHMYANDNKGQVPLAFSWYKHWVPNSMTDGGRTHRANLGALYPSYVADDARVLRCPTVEPRRQEWFTRDASGSIIPGADSWEVREMYRCRPLINIQPSSADVRRYPNRPWPKIHKLKNRPFVYDNIYRHTDLLKYHKDAINFAYTDGSARSVKITGGLKDRLNMVTMTAWDGFEHAQHLLGWWDRGSGSGRDNWEWTDWGSHNLDALLLQVDRLP